VSAQVDALIRDMGPEDVAAVARLESLSYTFPWSEGIFRDCLRAGYYCCLAELDGEVIGYGIMSVGAGEAHVLNLCVAERHRCKGLGASLLEHLMEFAAASGAEDIFLEVRPSNTPALHLYRTHGFTRIGIRRGYYQAVNGREDAVVLRRQLSSRGR
jgi:ribosomal-protein-alanine N-acetyltransferase